MTHPRLSNFKKRIQIEDSDLDTDRILRDVSSIVSLVSSPNSSRTRLSKAAAAVSLSLSVASIGKTVFDFIKERRDNSGYVLKITERDRLFEIAEKWLMDALPADEKPSIYVSSRTGYDESAHRSKVSVFSTYDGSIDYPVTIDGHTIKVSTALPEGAAKEKSDEAAPDQRRTPKAFNERVIKFNCPSHEAREAVVQALYKGLARDGDHLPGLYSVRWGNFERTTTLDTRDESSVVLKNGQMEMIMSHVTRFRENADTYRKIGVPHRTGILLYGPPGTGKTSTATAIATAMEMDMYYLSLKGLDDETLAALSLRIPKNSVVLLEDIDVCTDAAKSRDEKDGLSDDKVSLSALLNLLDGVQSPSGVVFILTTNKVEVLDEAVTRPGRVDLKVKLDYVNDEQLRRMVDYYTGSVPKELPVVTEANGISSADVVETVLKHIPEIENAGADIVKMVTEKVLTDLEV